LDVFAVSIISFATASWPTTQNYRDLGTSMGPRLFSRGNMPGFPQQAFPPQYASMGPRLFSRGNAAFVTPDVATSAKPCCERAIGSTAKYLG